MDSSIEEKRKQSKSYKTIKYDRFPLLLKREKKEDRSLEGADI